MALPNPYFPAAVAPLPTEVDGTSVVVASTTNQLSAEIIAIEQVLGINSGSTASSIGSQLNTLEVTKSPVTHTHSSLPQSVSVGGVTTAAYVEVSGDQIQGYNNGAVATLSIQTSGGDVLVGTSTSNTTVYGTLSATVVTPSSLRWKTDVESFSGGAACDIVSRLRPISFVRTSDGGRSIGLAAEEVRDIMPEAVVSDSDGNAVGINYAVLVPVLLSALQEMMLR